MSHPVPPRPFDLKTLLDRVKVRSLPPSWRRDIERLRHNQGGMLSVAQADKWAVRLGWHPAEIWPEWWTAPIGDEMPGRGAA